MTREQLKDLIEAIAALGIIVTLVFVVLEIRQNTDVARSATVQAMAAQSYDAATPWPRNAFDPFDDSSRCQRVIMFGLISNSRPIWALVTPG